VKPHVAAAVSIQEGGSESPLNFARRFIAWRRRQPQLTRGDIAFFDAPEPVLALRRELSPNPDGTPAMLAAFNLSNQAVEFEWPEAAHATDVAGHGLPASRTGARLALPPYGAWYGAV
jgi:alpha-glucosidase